MAQMGQLQIVEVAPRDGFQSIGPFIPTKTKIEVIEGLAEANLSRIEVGSFVSPKRLPQMADIGAILEAIARVPRLKTGAVLVPNLRGAELALAAGARHLVTVISATESHNQSNTGRSITRSLSELRQILSSAPADGVLRYNIAISFHCPFEGRVDPGRVLGIVEDALSVRSDIEIGLCDTIGKAMPHEVKMLFQECMTRFPNCKWAFHGHDTFGFGIANVLAAYEVGIRIIDAAIAGLGGCPFAPGASGNVATEDVVYAFERMGIAVNLSLEKLLHVARQAEELPGAEVGGHIRRVAGRGPQPVWPQRHT